jgi:hypothetical protein
MGFYELRANSQDAALEIQSRIQFLKLEIQKHMKKQVLHIMLVGLILFLSANINVLGQALPAATPIIPLSPNAAELNKYSSIPVNAMTGIPSISFPLYEINTGKIKVPISLSYHASGIKVNQRSTWVGLGWSLNAGGTISRAVRGDEDEKTLGWFNDPTPLTALNDLINLNATGTPQERYDSYYQMANEWVLQPYHDTHPDFFSYTSGSKSGKFIYSRSQQKFVSFPFQPVQINHNASNNTYKITDDNGTIYFYETKETAMFSVGPVNSERERVQSWYLSRIESVDGTDVVQFNYTTLGYALNNPETVKTYTKTYKKRNTQTLYTASAITSSESQSFNSILTLSEIIFSQGKVTFYANTSRQDYVGNALDSIVVYSNKAGAYERIQKFSFNYNYFLPDGITNPASGRLRLLSFSEVDVLTGTPLSHQFEYNSTNLPLINSNSADYWGFYNGATNFSLLPNVPPLQYELEMFGNVGDANRNPSFTHSLAGTLQRITYPTGGFDVFEFEPNKYTSDDPGTLSTTVTTLSLYGTGMTQEATQQVNFQFPEAAVTSTGHLHIEFSPYQPGGEGVPQELILRDLTTSTNVRTWEHSGNGLVTLTVDEDYFFDKTHQYRLIATVRNNTQTFISVSVSGQILDASTLITQGAGIRCKSVKTYNSDSALKLEEVYKYGVNEDGFGITLQTDKDLRKNFYTKTFKETTGLTSSGPCCSFEGGTMVTYVGSSSYSSFSFLGATVLYDYVAKYQMGNGSPNGKTVQQFKVPTDFKLLYNPGSVGGYEILDNSLFDQQLIKETKYAYNALTVAYSIVDETEYKYKKFNSSQETSVRPLENVVYFVSPSCTQDKVNCLAATGSDFHFPPYSIQLGCYRLDTVFQRTYSPTGSFVQTFKVYEYNNGQHLYPTGISSINSKGQLLKTVTRYPGDHQSSDPNSTVLDRMVLLNMLQDPYWNGEYINTALLKYVQTKYNNQWDANLNLVLPEKQELYTNKTATNLSNFIEFKSYDSHGNPLRLTSTQGVFKSYIWDYLSQYPIAEVVSNDEPTSSEIAYTSFEADGSGNWNIASASRSSDGITGTKCYQLSNGNISRNNLNTATEYTVSYWTKNSSALTISGTQGNAIQGRSVGDWKYFQHRISGVSQAIISGSGLIDELRLYPQGAQMTTYTYETLIGMTSQCDVANKIIYYEYDGMSRLKLLRDQDKNILKTFDYKYLQNTNQ